MASLVVRKDGRAEIRESFASERGPRSRSLAVFRELTDRDLEKAERRASRPFDRDRILARARQLGVPRYGESASRAGIQLLGELHQGKPLDASLAGALSATLAGIPKQPPPEAVAPLLEVLGSDLATRGEWLRERLRAMPGSQGVVSTGARYGTPDAPGRRLSPSKLPARDDRLAATSETLREAGHAFAFGGDVALAYAVAGGPVRVLELFVFEESLPAPLATSLRRDWTLVADPARPSRLAARRRRDVPFGEDRIPVLAPEDWLLAHVLGAADHGPDERDPDVERLLFACAGQLDVDSVLSALAGYENASPRAWLARQVERIAGPTS